MPLFAPFFPQESSSEGIAILWTRWRIPWKLLLLTFRTSEREWKDWEHDLVQLFSKFCPRSKSWRSCSRSHAYHRVAQLYLCKLHLGIPWWSSWWCSHRCFCGSHKVSCFWLSFLWAWRLWGRGSGRDWRDCMGRWGVFLHRWGDLWVLQRWSRWTFVGVASWQVRVFVLLTILSWTIGQPLNNYRCSWTDVLLKGHIPTNADPNSFTNPYNQHLIIVENTQHSGTSSQTGYLLWEVRALQKGILSKKGVVDISCYL